MSYCKNCENDLDTYDCENSGREDGCCSDSCAEIVNPPFYHQ